MCPYGDRCSNSLYFSDIASTGCHVRHHHLGQCIQYTYDGNRFYNASSWRDHIFAKHPNAPWYRNQLGIDSSLLNSLFRAIAPLSTDHVSTSQTSSSQPEEASVPVSAPAVPDDDVIDTLAHVNDVIDEPTGDEPVSEDPTSATPQGIDSYSIKDLKRIIQFLPSDLCQYKK